MKTFDEAVEKIHQGFETNSEWWPHFVANYGKDIQDSCHLNERIRVQITNAATKLIKVILTADTARQALEASGGALTTLFTIGVAIGIEMEKRELESFQ